MFGVDTVQFDCCRYFLLMKFKSPDTIQKYVVAQILSRNQCIHYVLKIQTKCQQLFFKSFSRSEYHSQIQIDHLSHFIFITPFLFLDMYHQLPSPSSFSYAVCLHHESPPVNWYVTNVVPPPSNLHRGYHVMN